MDTLSYKTISANKSTVNKLWVLVDAEGQTLGRLASKVAILLRGKHKPNFTPHMDMGDCVIVINAEKIVLSGSKEKDKTYFSHSGYPGATSFVDVSHVRKYHPERILESAIKGMLPKYKLGRKMMTHIRIYTGSSHPHFAQDPKEINL